MLKVVDLEVDFYNSEEKTHFKAVKKVSFEVAPGKALGIVGESGSGKSVTSYSIMRLHEAQSTEVHGSIELNGEALLSLNPEIFRSYRGSKIAMIFQEPMTSLNPVFSCGFQVAEAIQVHKKMSDAEAKAQTLALFEEVQLPRPESIFESYPHQLSGGQKQRVMIAMALSCNPELLIADEPTTALDVTVQKTILELLLKLKTERQMAMVFITHDLGVIAEIADDIAIMYRGEILEQGPAAEILYQPKHPYTKGLLACKPNPQLHLKKLPTVADFLNDTTEAWTDPENHISAQQDAARRAKLYAQQPLLKLEHLCKYYSQGRSLWGKSNLQVKAVDDINLEVFPGETLGLVGESGCGKSTLGRSILRLLEPSSGKIYFQGNDITTLPEAELRKLRREMQLIFQDPYASLNPRLTVAEAIMEPLRVHGLYENEHNRKVQVLALLNKVGLNESHFNRYPHEFSGGQRQRIVIARALALKPKFIICDESVSALDVSVQAQVLNLLKDLQAEFGLTYIFISHDLAVVKHISDRIVVMNKGQIEEIGFPEEIYYKPKALYTQKLIQAIPGQHLKPHL